ncbi:hypothetical protein LJC74_01245 [Eubacteriales bacterium OttesenSCG-928-A19]|nr:hypothetical protein [Eubacteriales bacterium OttesenSCG-928-A19]
MNDDSMFTLAESLSALREDKEALEERLEKVKAAIDEINFKLSEMMASTETQNFTRSGRMYILQTKTIASPVAAQKDALYQALKDNGFGDMVRETVNANSLTAFVKEQMAENADAIPSWLTGLVNTFDKTTVVVRKSSK